MKKSPLLNRTTIRYNVSNVLRQVRFLILNSLLFQLDFATLWLSPLLIGQSYRLVFKSKNN